MDFNFKNILHTGLLIFILVAAFPHDNLLRNKNSIYKSLSKYNCYLLVFPFSGAATPQFLHKTIQFACLNICLL